MRVTISTTAAIAKCRNSAIAGLQQLNERQRLVVPPTLSHDVTIHATLQAYFGQATHEDHRDRSWEYCFHHFHSCPPREIAANLDLAALHLGFYLASWGMYRGSGFLIDYAYTIHRGVIEALLDERFGVLWERDFGSEEDDSNFVPLVLDAARAVQEAYRPFAVRSKSRAVTDTLVTKVLLGTIGCLPACDRFFVSGFTKMRNPFSAVNRQFVQRVLEFCRENSSALRAEQARLQRAGKARYPFMKLVDMYFWQIGYLPSNPP